MEPFNLERVLAGEPVVTRDGREVTEIHFFRTCIEDRPIVAVIKGEIFIFKDNGFYFGSGYEHRLDLFMKSKVVEGWINVYVSESNQMFMSGTYHSEEQAKKNITQSNSYIKTIRVTNEI
jgi:hypothetical protein